MSPDLVEKATKTGKLLLKRINNTLGIERSPNILWSQDENFDFRIFDSPEGLEAAIRKFRYFLEKGVADSFQKEYSSIFPSIRQRFSLRNFV